MCVNMEVLVSVSICDPTVCLSGSQITDAGSEKFKLPDDGIDLFHGLTEKYVSILGFTERICAFLGSRRGVNSRILGRN